MVKYAEWVQDLKKKHEEKEIYFQDGLYETIK